MTTMLLVFCPSRAFFEMVAPTSEPSWPAPAPYRSCQSTEHTSDARSYSHPGVWAQRASGDDTPRFSSVVHVKRAQERRFMRGVEFLSLLARPQPSLDQPSVRVIRPRADAERIVITRVRSKDRVQTQRRHKVPCWERGPRHLVLDTT